MQGLDAFFSDCTVFRLLLCLSYSRCSILSGRGAALDEESLTHAVFDYYVQLAACTLFRNAGRVHYCKVLVRSGSTATVAGAPGVRDVSYRSLEHE